MCASFLDVQHRGDAMEHATQVMSPPEVHPHAFGVYSTETFWAESVAAFLAPPLREGGGAVAVVTAPHLRSLDRALVEVGVDVAAVRASGAYVTPDAQATLAGIMDEGRLDNDRFRALAANVIERSNRYPEGFRVYGEMAPLLWAAGDLVNALHLEELWNVALRERSLPLLCMYPVGEFEEAERTQSFVELCHLHTEVSPVEGYLTLVEPAPRPRAVALLQKQGCTARVDRERLRAGRQELQAHLTLATRRASERQADFDREILTRDLVGQAKGILMARWRVDAATAADMLVRAADRSRRTVADVARTVVDQQLHDNGARPSGPGAPRSATVRSSPTTMPPA
jgi:hypothetical protein